MTCEFPSDVNALCFQVGSQPVLSRVLPVFALRLIALHRYCVFFLLQMEGLRQPCPWQVSQGRFSSSILSLHVSGSVRQFSRSFMSDSL